MRWFGGDFDHHWRTLTLPRLFAGLRHLRRHPPADVLIAGYFGVQPPDEESGGESAEMPEPLPLHR